MKCKHKFCVIIIEHINFLPATDLSCSKMHEGNRKAICTIGWLLEDLV